VPPPTSAQFSLTLRVRIDHRPGMLGRVATAIGEAGGTIGNIELVDLDRRHTLRDLTVDAGDEEHERGIVDAVRAVEGAEVVDWTDRTMGMHVGGKLEVGPRHPLRTADDLSMAYTPGVARVCSAIAADPDKAFQYTIKRNTVAVVTDGTAVLGLGDIGPAAAMPVMEGKAMLFKEFAGVDAFPICLDTTDSEAIIATVKAIAPGFGGINLEDISAPRCFGIEERLKAELPIPVFHDDQHGTAVVVLAAVLNACKLTGRRIEQVRALIVGVGAAGIAVAKILLAAGVRDVIGCDSRGALHRWRDDYDRLPPMKRWLADETNGDGRAGAPAEVIEGADLFIGLSGARALPAAALGRMAPDAIVFAMANPTPEVEPHEAAPYARVIATGRSDHPNQINNVLCFPGIFRGALDVRAPAITEAMKMAAAEGIAAIVGDNELREDYVIPSAFNRAVAPAVAEAVAREARRSGSAEAAAGGFGYAGGETSEFGVMPS
jgi:malate dehydrogenase (oxaloacetate-decarboxylating)